MRPVMISVLSAGAICLALATSVWADPIPTGHVGFVALSRSEANGSISGNINTATTFTLVNWVSTFDDGVFAGMSSQSFGSVSFNTTIPTSLTFGNSVFGTFKSTSITVTANTPGILGIFVLGEWTPGTQGGVTGGPFMARLDLSFTQTPFFNGGISASATLATPPRLIPEPPGIVLGLTGLAAGVLVYLNRRRRDTFTVA